jgi:hypothetical protein
VSEWTYLQSRVQRGRYAHRFANNLRATGTDSDQALATMEQSPTISATSNASSCAEAVELLQLELEQGGTQRTRGDGVAERLKAVLEEATTSNDEDGVGVIVAHGGLELAVVALDTHPQHAGVQVSSPAEGRDGGNTAHEGLSAGWEVACVIKDDLLCACTRTYSMHARAAAQPSRVDAVTHNGTAWFTKACRGSYRWKN